jgi:HD-like signal output (HDOD) protein
MRMPGMDGATLLTHVQELYPDIVRIVLSGYAEVSQAVRAVGVAHQFLSKPCDSERLMAIIARALLLREELKGDGVQRILGRIDSLPPMPATSAALRQALTDPDVDLGEVGEIISHDPSLTAKLLQLVNSSLFGLARPVNDMREAASYLGITVLRHLTLSTESFRSFRSMKGPEGFKLEAEQAHAYLTARIARELIDDPDLKDEAFLAGILANIGRLVMAYQMTDLYEEVQAIVMAEGRPWAEVELELMGASHAQVGAYLLGLWGLPDSIVEAVAFHLHPSDFPHGEVGLIEVVHLAEHFAAEIEEAEFPDGPRRTNPLDLERLAATGLTARLDELRSRARRVATSADQAA